MILVKSFPQMVEWTRKEEGQAFPAVKPDADWIAALTPSTPKRSDLR